MNKTTDKHQSEILAAEQRGAEREREQCALVAEAETLTGTPPKAAPYEYIVVVAKTVELTGKSIAAAIRNRTGE